MANACHPTSMREGGDEVYLKAGELILAYKSNGNQTKKTSRKNQG